MTRTLRAAVTLAAVLGVRPALAAPPAAAGPDAGMKKKAVAPDASLAGSIRARGEAAAPAAPRLDFETFRYAVEVQVSGKRREEMADLEKLIRLGGSDAEMPGWLFRLAELHWEEAQHQFFEANRKDDAIAAAGGDQAQVERLRAERKVLADRSRAEQAAAVERYREIARRFPSYARLDEVLFFLGENLWKQNNRKQALEAYKVLITRFPKSRYVPDAWMAFGEHYFDSAEKGDRQQTLTKALESYKRAAAYTESSIYGYALYKQAWVHYNLGAWSQALDLFRAVIFFGDLPTSTVAPEKKLALAREARKDYVRTYSHVGSPQAAPDDFARVGGKDARDMLKSLAQLYYDEGKDRDAILVYHRMIVASPAAADAPLFQARIVTCAGRMGKKDLAVQQAGRFVEMLREAEKRGGDDAARKALADARKDAENTLRTLAVQYHAEFKKTREDAVAALAAELYRLHLDLFPASAQAYEMRFFHAELLYALEKFAEAGEEYTRVAELDIQRMKEPKDGAPQKPGKYLVDALESAVLAFDVVAKRAEATEPRPAGDARAPLPIPPAKARLLEACQRYLTYAPQGDKVVEVAYKAGQVYYRYNAFPEAVKLFSEIAEKHPRHELARYAANLTLDAFNLQGDWRSVNAWARRFGGDAELMKAQPALREDLGKVIEQSSFKLVEELERGKRHAEAADAYLAFVRDWPGSKLAATALFNASVDLVRAGRLDQAMDVREQLMARYPADPLVPRVVFTNAQDREAVGDFDRAAEAYERYFHGWYKAAAAARAARLTPAARARRSRATPAPPSGDAAGFEEAKARDALYDAGVLREGLGQLRRAEGDRQLFVETWPRSAEAPKVFLSIADLYRRERAPGKELRHLQKYQEEWVKDPTEWLVVQERIAKAYARAGNAGGERRAYEEALAYWKARRSRVGERGLPAVAQARYLALEKDYAEYDRIDFRVPARLSPQRQVRWLKDQAQLKGHKLLALQKAYTEVVNLKQAEPAVCALYRIGLAYKRFAQRFKEAPVPAELRRDQALAAEYRGQLAQLAEAPEKKSVEALEYAMTKSRELGVANGCSRATAEILAHYKPELYGPPLEKLPDLAAPAAAAPAAAAPPRHELLAALYEPPEREPAAAPASADSAERPARLSTGSGRADAAAPVRPSPSAAAPAGVAPRAGEDLRAEGLPAAEPERARKVLPTRAAPPPSPVPDEDLLP